jgi:hypothetical protein
MTGLAKATRAQRVLAWSLGPLVVLFLLLIGGAMAAYPGGTWEEPHGVGHRLWSNYFCDLLRPVAINGMPNPNGAQLAHVGLLVLCLALAPFFLIAPLAFAERRVLGRSVRVSGVLAAIGGVGIVTVPTYRFGSAAHGAMVLLAAVPGLTAAVTATIGAWSARPALRALRLCATGTLVCTAGAVGLFAVQLAEGRASTPGLAALQKLAVLLVLGWMVFSAAHVVRTRH